MDRLVIRRRNLPHWELDGATYFVTFRLFKELCHQAPMAPTERAYLRGMIAASHGSLWSVHVLTVMPDHVHVLATPLQQSPGEWYPLSMILRRIKGRSAREINLRRGRRGPFWQTESYDRIVRDADEFAEKAHYIINNAVKAGLVENGWRYEGFWCNPDEAMME